MSTEADQGVDRDWVTRDFITERVISVLDDHGIGGSLAWKIANDALGALLPLIESTHAEQARREMNVCVYCGDQWRDDQIDPFPYDAPLPDEGGPTGLCPSCGHECYALVCCDPCSAAGGTDMPVCHAALKSAAESIRSLRQQLAVAREDTRRLDWLESVSPDIHFYTTSTMLWIGGEEIEGDTLRAAIDAANQVEATE